MVEIATNELIKCIGDISNCLSFLDRSPSDRLRELYIQFLGPNYVEVRKELTKSYVFTVPEVLMALMSAFIFTHVLHRQAPDQEICEKLLELS